MYNSLLSSMRAYFDDFDSWADINYSNVKLSTDWLCMLNWSNIQ